MFGGIRGRGGFGQPRGRGNGYQGRGGFDQRGRGMNHRGRGIGYQVGRGFDPDPPNNANRGRGAGDRGRFRGRALGNRGRDNGADGRTTYPIGLEKLKKLPEIACNSELLEKVTMDGSFYALIDSQNKVDWERQRLILRILARASQFNEAHFRNTLHELLRRVVESKYLREWLPDSVLQLRNGLQQFTVATRDEKEKFIEEATILLIEILEKLPDAAMNISQIVTIVLDTLKDNDAFPDSGNDDQDRPSYRREQHRLQVWWNNYIERKRRQPEEAQLQPQSGRYDRQPLDSFRGLPILPREDEILTDERPRLRSNKIRGAYDGVEHYLDVQFRLLREDFVGPIREAINTVTIADQPDIGQQATRKGQHKLPIYRHAVFGEPDFDKRSSTMVYKLRFDVSQFHRINWETTRRLLQGSLLCFSSDGFKSLFFATIQERDGKELKKGHIQVTIDQFPVGGLARNVEYSFVESPSFFEAYKHVLKALQTIRDERDMPFVQHLVSCESTVEPPAYIQDNSSVDLSSLSVAKELDNQLIVQDVCIDTDWPLKERIGLDESQFVALKQALTKRLAVIQGPPGTGKTHVGLKIVDVLLKKMDSSLVGNRLLENRLLDKKDDKGPILVVCFTNHALDQFLAGIASMMPKGGDGKIVRIGGAARMAEEVKKFQLFNYLQDRRDSPQLHRELYDIKQQRKLLEVKIEAVKKLAMRRHDWFLTTGHISRVTNGQSDDTLFAVARRHTNIVRTNEDALHTWLFTNCRLEELSLSRAEQEAARRLSIYTGVRPDIAARAIKVSGTRNDGMAFAWLNNLYELTAIGYEEYEACFALDLERNNLQAAYNWLEESIGLERFANGQDRFGNGQEQPAEQINQAAAAQFKDQEDVENEEAVDIANEALDLERDFDDVVVDTIRGDDVDVDVDKQENQQAMFTQVGTSPRLPKFVVDSIRRSQPMNQAEAERAIQDPWALHVRNRWRLYRYWQVRWQGMAREEQRKWEEAYQRHTEKLREVQDLSLVHHLREAKIIGMTTTGAAKKQAVLYQLQPKVVVIEEAAEVLEAHIITSLSSGCEHLILIGDHKQLRPKPAVYELAKKYNLDVSLFERLINNGFTYAMLREQHRMRPEIADVLMPRFYDGLRNHASVYNRNHMLGVGKNMYFIDHRHLEANTVDGTSHKNMHEATFLVALCKYLIQQGYRADQITILSCYLAQMFEIKRMVTETLEEMDRPRVAVVDNFQGEENDIILLSMVRSNDEGRIGFLNLDNRVCVALSRAKCGFYVIGNFKHLADNSDLWKDLVDRLNASDTLGTSLELSCQLHGTSMRVTDAVDFKKHAPDGGCSEMCDTRLPCGHVCVRRCHPIDARHENVRCSRSCEKLCPKGHKCPRLCHEECGNCVEKVRKKLECGHSIMGRCFQSAVGMYCTERCERKLDCGHDCQQRCGDECEASKCKEKVERLLSCGHIVKMECHWNTATFKCTEKVKKTLPSCGHEIEMACSGDVYAVSCPIPCRAILKCEDVCAGTCGECRRGRLHKKCEQDCKRILICGHECKEKCSKACPPCEKLCENRCVHSRCAHSKVQGKKKGSKSGRTCGEPCPPCIEQCAWSCEHHQCDLRCFEPCTRKRCTEPCKKKKKKCGHDCIGVCGEECPKLCRQCDREKYNEVLEQQNQLYPIEDDEKDTARFVQLDCGHLFEVNFLDQWFDVQIGQMKENTESTQIKLLQCLLCNTKVRTTQRYGSIAKQCLLDTQKVKSVGRGDALELQEQRLQLAHKLDSAVVRGTSRVHDHFKTARGVLNELVVKPDACHLNKNRLVSIDNLARLLEEMIHFKDTEVRKLERQAVDRGPTGRCTLKASGPVTVRFINQFFPTGNGARTNEKSDMMELVKIIDREISFLATWIVNNAKSCSEQMIDEFANECRRTTVFAQLIEVLMQISTKGKEIEKDSWTLVEDVMKVFNGTVPFNADLEKAVKEKIKRVYAESGCGSGLGISEQERIEINKAMNFTQGHWFKCPNGHIYCIGECGGAMEEGKCPECKATIGGGSHRLRDDNAVASEMDGARRPAYGMNVDADLALAMRLQHAWNEL